MSIDQKNAKIRREIYLDVESEAKYYGNLYRIGELSIDAITFGAFLKHPPFLICAENLGLLKPAGVIYKSTLVDNREMIDIIQNLHTWGRDIDNIAALSLSRVYLKKINATSVFVELNKLTEDILETLLGKIPFRMDENFRYLIEQSSEYIRYTSNLDSLRAKISRDVLIAISRRRPVYSLLLRFRSYLSDKEILTTLQNTLIPYALGDLL